MIQIFRINSVHQRLSKHSLTYCFSIEITMYTLALDMCCIISYFSRMDKSDVEALTKVIYGEARGEPYEGKVAVAHVVLNRARKNGTSIQTEASRPHQFEGYAAAGRMSETAARDECERIAQDVIAGRVSDPTQGARHFCTKNCNPNWASGKTPCATIGNHKFFNDVQ